MRTARFSPIDRVCPGCGAKDNQVFNGHTKSGSQRCMCKYCKKVYNLEPKKNGYPEDIIEQVIKDYYDGDGMSGRALGLKYGMSGTNVYNWLKKIQLGWISAFPQPAECEIDEIVWFIKAKKQKIRHNIVFCLMITYEPRKVINYVLVSTLTYVQVQQMVDDSPKFKIYKTDGAHAYTSTNYCGEHICNPVNKADTHDIESINADFRQHIPGLHRSSRCFYRTWETLEAVLDCFIEAYNDYSEAKWAYQQFSPEARVQHRSNSTSNHLHEYKPFPKRLVDFI